MATLIKAKVSKVKGKASKPFKTKAPIPPLMKAVKLNWLSILGMAEHCVNILQSEGETVLDIVRGIMKMIQAVSERDLFTIFAQLNKTTADVNKVVDAIKKEFGIE